MSPCLNPSTPTILDYTPQVASADLLNQTPSGKTLKKAITNDRSMPQVEAKKAGGAGIGSGSAAAPTIAGRSNRAPQRQLLGEEGLHRSAGSLQAEYPS